MYINNLPRVALDWDLNPQPNDCKSSTRDVRNRFFNFGSVSVLEKNSDSVRNEFGSVRFAKTWFGSDSYLLLT